MAVRGQDIASVIKRQIEDFGGQLQMVDVGVVVEVGDGIARVHGLSGVAYNELVEFEGGIVGMALNLEEDNVGIVILGDPLGVKEGSEVRSTKRIVEVPVGEGLIGRIVDGIGRPVDGKGPIASATIERLRARRCSASRSVCLTTEASLSDPIACVYPMVTNGTYAGRPWTK